MNKTIYIASAFSKEFRGGNKAGVMFCEKTLTGIQKKAIAKDLGYSETVFISESEVANFKLEYFTAKEEVDLCGHATIAAFIVLKHLKKIRKKSYTIETSIGNLDIKIEEDVIFMEQNKPSFCELIPSNKFNDCFGFGCIDEKYPIQIVSTGLKDILVPIRNIEIMHRMQPNFKKIKEISEQYDVIGIHTYTLSNSNTLCRNFAPLQNINEEAATGTANAALACYLHEHNILSKEVYQFEQGYSLNSPSRIIVKLSTNIKNEIMKVYVGGTGYYCGTKKI
ncbi:PhzF family phenazine biosynthesis protein [Enterococcus avium]